MPIFEYRCKDCGKDFELLVRSDTRIECSGCHSENVVKKFSLFSAQVKRAESTAPACHTDHAGCDPGKCGSGFCGVE